MKHLHGYFNSQYIDRKDLKYSVRGNFTSLPANEAENHTKNNLIHIHYHKIEEWDGNLNPPQTADLFIMQRDNQWDIGYYRNQQFIPSPTHFNSWLQDVILENYIQLEEKAQFQI